MTENFNGDINRRKNLIVSESPLLQVFIDGYTKGDPDMWLKIVNKVFDEKKREMITVLGSERVNHDLRGFLKITDEYDVFPEETDAVTKLGLTACFVWMGYEIGEKEDAFLFLDDIINQVLRFSTICDTLDSRAYVRGAMTCGVDWKKEVQNDAPSEFVDFISKMDF